MSQETLKKRLNADRSQDGTIRGKMTRKDDCERRFRFYMDACGSGSIWGQNGIIAGV